MEKSCPQCSESNDIDAELCVNCSFKFVFTSTEVHTVLQELDDVRMGFMEQICLLENKIMQIEEYNFSKDKKELEQKRFVYNITQNFGGFMETNGIAYFSEDATKSIDLIEKYPKLFETGKAIMLAEAEYQRRLEHVNLIDPLDLTDGVMADILSGIHTIKDGLASVTSKNLFILNQSPEALATELGGMIDDIGMILFPVDYTLSADTYYKRSQLVKQGRAKVVLASEYQVLTSKLHEQDNPTRVIEKPDDVSVFEDYDIDLSEEELANRLGGLYAEKESVIIFPADYNITPENRYQRIKLVKAGRAKVVSEDEYLSYKKVIEKNNK